MHIAFFVPGIHDRPTGGNVYNRRVTAALPDPTSVEMIPWPSGSARPSLALPHDTVLVVDSLLVNRLGELEGLRAAHPTASLVLLAHYLHCIDPTAHDTAAAATERAVLPHVDGIVTTSAFAKRALVDTGVPPDRIGVAPPGLDESYRAPHPDRASDGSPSRLLTVASLLPGKGLPRLLDVLGRLTDRAWTWTLVGDDTLDPDFAASLRKQLQSCSFSNRVTITGAVPPATLQARYDRADVFVLPSRFETCSMATREAMARGCPVVAFDVGGLSENLGDASAGRLVPPDDTAAFATALRALLDTPDTRRRMGIAARKRSESFPSWAATAAQFHDVLRRLSRTSR